jgi:hypothetical protein
VIGIILALGDSAEERIGTVFREDVARRGLQLDRDSTKVREVDGVSTLGLSFARPAADPTSGIKSASIQGTRTKEDIRCFTSDPKFASNLSSSGWSLFSSLHIESSSL